MLNSDSSSVNGTRNFRGSTFMHYRYAREFFFPESRLKNTVLLYVTLTYFNSDKDMDTLLSGNKNAMDLNLIYSLLSV